MQQSGEGREVADGASADSISLSAAIDDQSSEPALSSADTQDELCAALAAAMPVDTNIDLVLDKLAASTNLFDVPNLDISAFGDLGSDTG
jgi:hypothetical protein